MTPMLHVSPLSPERVWAMLESGTFIRIPRPIQATQRLSSQHLDRGSDVFPRNQRGPVSHDLSDRRAAFAEAGGAGRAVEHERNQLAGEAVDGFAVCAADADAELDLGRIRAGLGDRAVAGVHAEE